ncbi:helix-turn-helix domain-containing protein [Microbacteriaceae bacterium VKM Ac-2855]|nr:helix-turn-helix domain-containing protein [Microbacteriaceae bacterium VKM Ac-2855]
MTRHHQQHRPGPHGQHHEVARGALELLSALAADPGTNLGIVARRPDVSPLRLQIAFRRSYGISAARFLRHRRLLRADEVMDVIRPGRATLADVATAAGFTSITALSRAWYRERGTSAYSSWLLTNPHELGGARLQTSADRLPDGGAIARSPATPPAARP